MRALVRAVRDLDGLAGVRTPVSISDRVRQAGCNGSPAFRTPDAAVGRPTRAGVREPRSRGNRGEPGGPGPGGAVAASSGCPARAPIACSCRCDYWATTAKPRRWRRRSCSVLIGHPLPGSTHLLHLALPDSRPRSDCTLESPPAIGRPARSTRTATACFPRRCPSQQAENSELRLAPRPCPRRSTALAAYRDRIARHREV